MRIAQTIHSLEGGGAQRAAVVLAGGFASQSDTVMILTSLGEDTDFYQLPGGIARRSIGPSGSGRGGALSRIASNVRRQRSLRKSLLEFRPDVVISFMGVMNVRVLLALIGSAVPIVVCEQTDSRFEGLPLFWRLARRFLYHRATKIVSVSQGVDRGFDWLPSSRRTVLNNPLPPELADKDLTPETPFDEKRRRLVSMGRLTHAKGHDALIAAFADVARDHASWDLLILGEGEDREALERLVDQLGLEGRVRLPGAVPDPFPTLRRCEIFVLASRWEGFGNVLAEAMACGLPVIAADCPSGPAEIVEHGSNGLLVPTEKVDQLAAAMRRMMDDEAMRRQMGARASQSVTKFSRDTIVAQWEDKILSPLRGSPDCGAEAANDQ